MRAVLALLLLGSCTKATPDHSEPPPTPPGPITPHLDAGVVDAPSDAPPPIDAPTSSAPIAIKPLPMAGPYKTLDDSCAAARPCGEVGDPGGVVTPPKTPDCTAVLDPSRNPIDHVPETIASSAGMEPKLIHNVGKNNDEIRIGAVMCSVAKGMRGEPTEHYVFVHRKDGWWRTAQPLMSWTYNDKYCSGSIYVNWNTNDARTILGIAAGQNCLACGKQGYSEDITELMVRVETGGPTPLVFAPLLVGTRSKTWRMPEFTGPGIDPKMLNEPDCALGQTATSLTETWPSADDVILSGGNGTGGPLENMITIVFDGTPLAAPGRYRFVR